MTNKLIQFLKHKIWLLPEQQLPFPRASLIKTLKISLLAHQGFVRDLCVLRASALTLYTLLAIVPIIAMLFGIAKGFGLEKILEQQIFEQIPHQETTVLNLINFAQKLLESTKGEVVAGIGVIVLLWSAINMISSIEESFNAIWKVKQARTLGRKLSDYLSLMLLGPLLLILSSSISVFMSTQLTWLTSFLEVPKLSEGLVHVLKYSSLVLISGLFAGIFIVMPNHKVNVKAGVFAGVFTGVLFELLQKLYFGLQIGVSSYNAVYGSFAALPLFVVWVQMGWMSLLLGCEICFFIHHYESHRHNYHFSDFSFALIKTLSLQATRLVIKRFVQSGAPSKAEEIAYSLKVSPAIIQTLLNLLVESRILLHFISDDDEEVYLPAVDVSQITLAFVINALEQCGQNALPDSITEPIFEDFLAEFGRRLETSTENVLLRDL